MYKSPVVINKDINMNSKRITSSRSVIGSWPLDHESKVEIKRNS